MIQENIQELFRDMFPIKPEGAEMYLATFICQDSGYFGGFHAKEEEIIRYYMKSPCLHLFSGSSKLGDVRVDLNPKSNATHIQDVLEFLEQNTQSFETVILDPPYNKTAIEKYAKDSGLPEEKFFFPDNFRHRDQTMRLYKGLKKLYPGRIIWKGWVVPPWKNIQYRPKIWVVGVWGGAHYTTNLIIFERKYASSSQQNRNLHPLSLDQWAQPKSSPQ